MEIEKFRFKDSDYAVKKVFKNDIRKLIF